MKPLDPDLSGLSYIPIKFFLRKNFSYHKIHNLKRQCQYVKLPGTLLYIVLELILIKFFSEKF